MSADADVRFVGEGGHDASYWSLWYVFHLITLRCSTIPGEGGLSRECRTWARESGGGGKEEDDGGAWISDKDTCDEGKEEEEEDVAAAEEAGSQQ